MLISFFLGGSALLDPGCDIGEQNPTLMPQRSGGSAGCWGRGLRAGGEVGLWARDLVTGTRWRGSLAFLGKGMKGEVNSLSLDTSSSCTTWFLQTLVCLHCACLKASALQPLLRL